MIPAELEYIVMAEFFHISPTEPPGWPVQVYEDVRMFLAAQAQAHKAREKLERAKATVRQRMGR